MNSKRAALWLAIGGLTLGGLTLGNGVSIADAADRFVSDASFQSGTGEPTTQRALHQSEPTATGLLRKIGHQQCDDGACDAACDCEAECEAECGCEAECETSCDGTCCEGCDSCCGAGAGDSGGLLGGLCDCDLGEPFSLFGEACGYTIGGWAQLGYHSKAIPLFNRRPDEYQLHQAWLYAEKAIDTSEGFDVGGRLDYVYGTDGPDTQAFGIANDHWDNDWDNGPDNSGYGHAIPQAYMEAGYGDLSIKAGHFFTLIGYEVVAAPDNFFYSHAYTMYNSEPFTHTGALATYNASDDLTLYGGYVLGWDSGFEDNGDAFLGGASLGVSDDVTVTYASIGGRFSKAYPNGGASERGYMHSIVTSVALTEQLQYVNQTDLLNSQNAAGDTVRDTFGINNYLLYTISDCIAVGGRFEWYSADAGVLGITSPVDVYAATLGANFKPHANVMIRPEVRFDNVDGNPAGILENSSDEQTAFGIDSIFLF